MVFSADEKEDISLLNIGTKSGQFKNEYPKHEILEFISLGPHAYHLRMKDLTSNQETEISKVVGFQLQQNIVPEVNSNTFEMLLEKALKSEKVKIQIDQIKTFRSLTKVSEELLRFHLCNDIRTRRVVLKDGSTLPFGYRK